jgi:D-beta-D-heptose 7-phosphate kinase/D-beta-D-heptose 1-phosphate adenosyltransferase
VESPQVVVASDYLKGTITEPLFKALLASRPSQTPVLVDPKIPHLLWYAGATVITPNHHEAEAATHRQIRTDDDARAAALEFRARARCGAVVITRGEHGMWVSEPGVEASIPSVAREVADVTGAGDTVIATLALGLAAGGTLVEAASLANQAAGLVVARFGTSPVHRGELAGLFDRP